jgi:MFS family permease
LDLVCENENKRNFLGTILILAMLFGSFIGGRIGDQYGRKKVFLAAILIAVPSIIIQVFLNSFEGKWTKIK